MLSGGGKWQCADKIRGLSKVISKIRKAKWFALILIIIVILVIPTSSIRFYVDTKTGTVAKYFALLDFAVLRLSVEEPVWVVEKWPMDGLGEQHWLFVNGRKLFYRESARGVGGSFASAVSQLESAVRALKPPDAEKRRIVSEVMGILRADPRQAGDCFVYLEDDQLIVDFNGMIKVWRRSP